MNLKSGILVRSTMKTYVYLDGVYWLYSPSNVDTIKQKMKDSRVSTTDILIKDETSDDYKYLKTNDALNYDQVSDILTKIVSAH